ncbi:MAG: sugar transferase [Pseudomonadota bacterium]
MKHSSAQEFDDGYELASHDATPYRSGLAGPNGILKRGFDIAGGVAMLVLFAPLMAIVAAMIWRHDGAPILFAHARVGRGGRTFHCYKFRTMIRDAETVLQQHLANNPQAAQEWRETRKLREDPRIIGQIGQFLRRNSLDELPQILNVIRGDMSLVGPRPIITSELSLYGRDAAVYLSARPGLTGPWQVSGRNLVSYQERVAMDVNYVRNWRLSWDIQIVCQTALLVLRGDKGAY